MLKKSALIIAMSLAAGSAFAHAIPAATGGDPYTINQQPLVGSNNNYSALNITAGFNKFAGAMFDVTTAGSLDVYSDDNYGAFNGVDLAPGAVEANDLYVFKLDADGLDWTLVNFSDAAPRINPGTNATVNIYGAGISYWEQTNPGQDSGASDPGLTANFDTGTYLALYVSGLSAIAPIGEGYAALAASAKLSGGFFAQDLYALGESPVNLYVRASAGSTAAFIPTVDAPAPAQVPVPGAIWLMGSVLAGFGAFGRKKAVAA